MKFLVKRTSLWSGTEQPCDEAVDTAPAPSFWEPKWEVEFSSLDDLAKFLDKYDRLVLSKVPWNESEKGETRPYLEIYDEYRE